MKDNKHSKERQPNIALALGSGIARGFAHIGVLRALRKHGFVPDMIAGTSIGAVVGGAYLAGKLNVLEDWALSLNRKRIVSYLDFKMGSGGLIKGQKILDLLSENVGDMCIEDLDRKFVALATDMVTGHEVWLRDGYIRDALRASFSLPGVFPPMKVGKQFLIDGALVNPVPVSVCRAQNPKMTIAIDLNADLISRNLSKTENIPKAAGFDIKEMRKDKKLGIMNMFSRKIFDRDPNNPSVFGVMVSSLGIILDRTTRSRLAGDPPDVHIKPRVGHIGLMEFDRAQELIIEGEAVVERMLPELVTARKVLLENN